MKNEPMGRPLSFRLLRWLISVQTHTCVCGYQGRGWDYIGIQRWGRLGHPDSFLGNCPHCHSTHHLGSLPSLLGGRA